MYPIDTCIDELRTKLPEIEIRINEPMNRHTTFGIGGPADLFIFPHSAEQLAAAQAVLRKHTIPILLIGNGSNMLIADSGIRGAVIGTAGMDQVRLEGEYTIEAQAGALLSRVAQQAQRAALTGAEFAAGIPGSVGGAVFMNAGAYDGQMNNMVKKTIYLDEKGEIRELSGPEHKFDYRYSVFRDHPEWTIVSTVLEMKPGDPQEIQDKMNDFAQRRREKQPLNYPSAGSTFKRPSGYFAGKLIEDAGLKGVSIGGAQVSEKHAGFLINRGGATCEEMLRLIELVQQRVLAQFGVALECEVRIVR